jgi:four helix bundle protein
MRYRGDDMKLQIPTSKLQRNFKIQKNLNDQAEIRYPQARGAHTRQAVPPGYDDPLSPAGRWLVREELPAKNARHPFDLEERTARFGEAIVRFSKRIPRGPTNNRLIDQIVGCGTSVGANYCEANEGVSKKDFRYVIGRCVMEAKETKFFLRMIAVAEPNLAEEARLLYREAKELHLIFASIYRKSS